MTILPFTHSDADTAARARLAAEYHSSARELAEAARKAHHFERSTPGSREQHRLVSELLDVLCEVIRDEAG